jgi:hypothetical protein
MASARTLTRTLPNMFITKSGIISGTGGTRRSGSAAIVMAIATASGAKQRQTLGEGSA